MIARRLRVMVAIVALLPLSAVSAQSRANATTLELVSLTGQRRAITAADLAKLPHVETEASSHNVVGKYRGVRLGDLLRLAGKPSSDSMRGPVLAQYALIEAKDGYHSVFALAELDSAFTDKTVILADTKNGAPLDSTEGPFRVIAAGEKRPARWVRGVTRIYLKRGEP